MNNLTEKWQQNESLAASKLINDPRVSEAKRLILEAVEEHQKKIVAVKPPNPELKTEYNTLINAFGELRGGMLWYPFLGSGLGRGALVELLDGSIKYDFISGIGVHYWGHSHRDLIEASIDAAFNDTVMQGNLQQNRESVLLIDLLVRASGLDHCFLTTSGAMANENALKITFQKKFPASRILAFDRNFAGRSLITAQISDKPMYREGLPQMASVDYVPFFDSQRPEQSIQEALAALKRQLSRYPKQHAAMVFELVQGESGYYPGSHDFFVALMEELRRHEVAIIIDEVQTFGRTSQLFAFQHFDIGKYADIVTFGKLSQVCGTLFRGEFKPKAGLLSQTFTGSTSAIRAGRVIIEGLLKRNYFGKKGEIEQLYEHMVKRLNKISERNPSLLTGPWGLGSMIALTVFGGDKDKTLKFTHDLFDAGVICFVAGADPMRIRFSLPVGAVTFEDIDAACGIIEKVLTKNN